MSVANAAPPSPKCARLASALPAVVRLKATGARDNNDLVRFLKCEVQARKACLDAAQAHSLCHRSVMSVGAFDGKSDCGDALQALHACLAAQPA
mmetsp:Transcript_29222/g.100896  ORF Transcript_29222/g.100896 Transcript_29222/m.100896 type:complete len:94 (+) Transcript_29222:50-331(+)